MAGLEGSPHDGDIASAVKGVVAATIGHLNQLVDNRLSLELGGVDKVSGTKLLGPLLFGGVDIYNNNLARLVGDGTLNNGQTDAASTEDGDVGALLNIGGDTGSTVSGGDTATEQTCSVHGGIVLDSHHGDVGEDSVLREGGCAHEMEEILALAPESRGTIGHHTLALGGSDLATEVGLARLAELAFLALRSAVSQKQSANEYYINHITSYQWVLGFVLKGNDMVARLHVGDALTNRLDNTSTLVSQDNRESTLGILAGEGVCI